MNLSSLSRAELVRELLSPLVCASGANPLHVSDAVAQMGMLGTTDTVLGPSLGHCSRTAATRAAGADA
jgi:DNA repair protein RadC